MRQLKIKVLHPYRKDLDIEGPMNLKGLLDLLEVSFNDVLVLRNNVGIVNDLDFELEEDDFIQVLPVLAGG